ncbi:hypothetical protein [Mesorhizobium sp.]|uniref:hypothetical protein n=1 Tax=Mesorhizobium sp. TaxID=1871066 RepID=UPI0011F644CE|nr:hypothetical protein [Mesorhizobium sp.]TIL35952.1 MAG: hypothetical protein E5Y82_22060 [Mesorhizobium sp.]
MIDDFAFPTAESRMITFQIGAICVNWSQIDASLGMILGKYIKVPSEHINVATSVLDLSRKCELIKALAFIAEDRRPYGKLEKALNFLDSELRPIRNRYVHDSYSFFTGKNTRKVFRTKIVSIQSFKKELFTKAEHPVTQEELITFNADLDVFGQFIVGHLMGMLLTRESAKANALEAFDAVLKESFDNLVDVIKRYRSQSKPKLR